MTEMTISNIKNIKSFMINLPQFPQKYERSMRQLSAISVEPQRVDAVYGKDLDDNFIKSITYPSVHYTMNRGRSVDSDISSHGAIGCYISHIKLWQQLVEEDDDMYLIMEDDVTVDITVEKIDLFLEEVYQNHADWDVILLGWMKPLPETIGKDGDIRLSSNVYKCNDITFGMHAYLINRKGAKRLLKNAFPIVDQVDSYLSYMACRGDISMYRSPKSFINQHNIEGSSIQDSFSNLNIKPILNRFSHTTIRGWLIFFMLCLVILIVLIILFMRKKSN
jgi:glycosyl transferase family 25